MYLLEEKFQCSGTDTTSTAGPWITLFRSTLFCYEVDKGEKKNQFAARATVCVEFAPSTNVCMAFLQVLGCPPTSERCASSVNCCGYIVPWWVGVDVSAPCKGMASCGALVPTLRPELWGEALPMLPRTGIHSASYRKSIAVSSSREEFLLLQVTNQAKTQRVEGRR